MAFEQVEKRRHWSTEYEKILVALTTGHPGDLVETSKPSSTQSRDFESQYCRVRTVQICEVKAIKLKSPLVPKTFDVSTVGEGKG